MSIVERRFLSTPLGFVTRPTFFPFNPGKPFFSRTSMPGSTSGFFLDAASEDGTCEIRRITDRTVAMSALLVNISDSLSFIIGGFLSEGWLNLYAGCDGDGRHTAQHHHPEEVHISEPLL